MMTGRAASHEILHVQRERAVLTVARHFRRVDQRFILVETDQSLFGNVIPCGRVTRTGVERAERDVHAVGQSAQIDDHRFAGIAILRGSDFHGVRTAVDGQPAVALICIVAVSKGHPLLLNIGDVPVVAVGHQSGGKRDCPVRILQGGNQGPFRLLCRNNP